MDDDLSVFSIGRAADAGLSFSIPWHRERRPLAGGFDAKRMTAAEGPWRTQSPFASSALLRPIFRSMLRGGSNRDTNGHSSAHSTSSEHLSSNLGAGIGNAVARASVTTAYDRTMQESTNTSRASRNSSCRYGHIALVEEPPFSAEAIQLLALKNGPQLFTDRYGSYYVASYVVGADAGGCLIASNRTARTDEARSVTTKVEALWATYTSTKQATSTSEVSSMDLVYRGYDTLDGTSIALSARAGEPTHHIHAAASESMTKANALQQRLSDRVRMLGLRDGFTATATQCAAAVEAGVVVELVLLPFARLRDYARVVYAEKIVETLES